VDFREERFLFELPYDSRLGPNFANHGKDVPHAPRESGWERFDLQLWLGLDSPPVEGSMSCTTLIFGSATGNVDPTHYVQEAFPSYFGLSRAAHWPRWRRWLYDQRLARWWRSIHTDRGIPTRKTVVLVVRIAEQPDELSEDWRFEQLCLGLARLNDFLLAAATVHGDPELAPVSLQDLPPIVFGMGWDIPRSGVPPAEIDFWSYIVNDRIPQRPRQPLTREEADLAMWFTVERDHPLVTASHLFLSAQQAHYRGELTHAVIDAGTAVETLVSAAVRLVAPERGYPPEKVDKALRAPFRGLVQDHFAKLLGYSREVDESGDALGTWWQEGYKIRNAVVHEGLKANEDQVAQALGSAMQLQRDFTERLRAKGLGDKLPGVPVNVKEAADRARAEAGELDL
jgi:hypothetical protein